MYVFEFLIDFFGRKPKCEFSVPTPIKEFYGNEENSLLIPLLERRARIHPIGLFDCKDNGNVIFFLGFSNDVKSNLK